MELAILDRIVTTIFAIAECATHCAWNTACRNILKRKALLSSKPPYFFIRSNNLTVLPPLSRLNQSCIDAGNSGRPGSGRE